MCAQMHEAYRIVDKINKIVQCTDRKDNPTFLNRAENFSSFQSWNFFLILTKRRA